MLVYARLEIEELFPRDYYYESRWASWECRIKQGHADEETAINRFLEEGLKHRKAEPDSDFDPAEIAGEDYGNTCELTTLMYAALVVGMWSGVERFMKMLVSIAGKRINPGAKTKSSWRWPDLCDTLKEYCGIDAGACNAYKFVNAIRILNNVFKHNDGHYRPASGQLGIDPDLLTKWAILGKHELVDYSKLPIEELVAACGEFFADLLEKLEIALDKLPAEPSENPAGRPLN